MAGKTQKRCLICGRLFEIDALVETAAETAFFDDLPPKTSSFCPLCAAKVKKDALNSQENPKPL